MTAAALASVILERLAGIGRDGAVALPSIHAAGRAGPAASGADFASIDPSTESELARVARGSSEDVDRAATAAREALDGPWGRLTPQERGNLLLEFAAVVEANAEALARLEAHDAGKPIGSARGDVRGAVATLRYCAGAADKLEGISVPLGRDVVDFTELEPLGVTAHVTPWNYPLGMAMRSLGPALAAGCTAVLKPAEETPLSTLALAELALAAGLPAGVVNVVTGFGEEAGAALTAHPLVDGVTFTGSVETGRLVGAAAGRGIKPVVLELGGKNAMIVFEDADLDRAVAAALDGGFDNSGQVCSSASRLLLHPAIKAEFLALLREGAARITVGPAFDDPAIGPLVSAEHYGKVTGHIAAALEAGARLVQGGGRPEGLSRGYFLEPTIFDAVDPASAIAREEVFGPVVVALDFETEAEAVALANALPYGLAAGVQTRDIDRALRLARRLRAGSVWVNGWFMGGVQAPTGGVKESGVGRERGMAGIHNYVSIKNIAVQIKDAR